MGEGRTAYLWVREGEVGGGGSYCLPLGGGGSYCLPLGGGG